MYTFYEDSGHGWLRVTKDEIRDLNLTDNISSYSYENGKYIYLEEDSDLAKFLRAKQMDDSTPDKKKWVCNHIREWWDTHVTMKYSERSSIRRYNSYDINTVM